MIGTRIIPRVKIGDPLVAAGRRITSAGMLHAHYDAVALRLRGPRQRALPLLRLPPPVFWQSPFRRRGRRRARRLRRSMPRPI